MILFFKIAHDDGAALFYRRITKNVAIRHRVHSLEITDQKKREGKKKKKMQVQNIFCVSLCTLIAQ